MAVLCRNSFMYFIFTTSLLFFFSFVVLGIKPRASCMLGKRSPSELQPQLLTVSVDCVE